ncbi:MAG TPA: PAS domain S-box protein [Verrucomicrobiae bacterium]|nr:PAS domain S-box protein [Verrucomicrobiae bacterium]
MHRHVYELLDRIRRTKSLGEIYDAALDSILTAIGCDRASILLFDDAGVMRFVAWKGLSDGYRKAVEGHSPWTIDTKDPQPISMSDIRSVDLETNLRKVIQAEGIHALAFIPLIFGGALVGKFMIYYDAPHKITRDELALAQAIGAESAFGIERQRGQEALRESESRKSAILNSALDCIITIDHEGKILEANQAFERTFGYSRPEVLGKSMAELIIPERYREAHHRGLAGYLATGRGAVLGRRIEISAIRRDGHEFPVELGIVAIPREGRPLFTGTLRDITERKRSEAAVRESREQLQLISDSVPALICYVDNERRYQMSNRAHTTWLGLAREDIIGRHMWQVVGDEAWRVIQPHVEAALAGQPVEFETEAKYQRGEPRWVHVVYIPHRDTAGRVLGLVVMVTDITERKRAQETLERMVAARTASLDESLKSLETLLYTIAHDLRAPNRAMQGFAQLLTQGYADKLDDEGRFFLERISQGALRNERLIRDLLEFGRLVHAEVPCQLMNPQPAIAAALTALDPELKRSQTAVEVTPQWPEVWANDSALGHVLTNLVSNAIKYVKPNTQPSVRIFPEVVPSTRRVRICVQDNGIGVAPEQHERIFEPFQRAATGKYEGTGMGLAIVRKAAERMGGSSGVKSKIGDGSCFWVELLSTTPSSYGATNA